MTTTKSVFLMGGVGNQLFQIARACSHREKGYDVCVLQLSRNKNRIYRLIGFTNHDDWVGIDQVLHKLSLSTKEVSYRQMMVLILMFFLRRLGVNRYFDTEVNEAANFYKIGIDVGYFQSENHLTPNSVKEVGYALIDLLKIERNKNNAIIALHIRGGDFIQSNRLNECDIESVKDLARKRALKIYVVTNDTTFALEVCGSDDNIFAHDSSGARDDFTFLARSKVLFLSNSTFAFWAAIVASMANGAELLSSESFPWKPLINVADLNR